MAAPTGPEYRKRLDQLFVRLVELPRELRDEYIDETCGGDAELRRDLKERLYRPALALGSRFADYEILAVLGEGGMGRVYLAQDTRLPRLVALKTVSPDSAETDEIARRFQREAWAASSLNHPNVVTVYEVGQYEGRFFIASEFVEGLTLRQKLAQSLDARSTLDIAIQAAAGLSAAHAAGIVHRDIKPENLMVRPDGLVKILDFGLARIGPRSVRRSEAGGTGSARIENDTQPGIVLGTTKYMSPEQARGLPMDARTDIFSLGGIMYEMLAGAPPFDGETDSDCIAAILFRDPPLISKMAPGAPSELVAIVERAMRKQREERYQSAAEMLADLQAAKNTLQLRESSGRTASTTKSRMLKPGLVVVAILIIIAVVIGFLRSRAPEIPVSAHPRSLAVLPFHNLKQDPANDFLGFSLADAIITKFGYVSAIAIRPSSAVEKYRNQLVDPQKAGRDLDADVLLNGTYARSGDRLHINIQLIDVKQNRVEWQQTLDVAYEDLFGVQDQVAKQVIHQLRLNLSEGEAGNVGFDNRIGREAYEAYLRGVDLYAINDFPAAIRFLETSASMEPNYALTWAHLGQAYTTNASLDFGGRNQYRKAQEAYEKALELNPALIEARVYMANLFTDTGRVEESAPLLRAALQTNPNSADAHWELGYAYRFAGLLRESVRECERARQIDPQVKLYSSALNSYLYLGEYDRFLASLPQSDTVYILFYRGFGEYYKHDAAAARSHFERAWVLNPSLFQAALSQAFASAMEHDNANGVRVLRETANRMRERGVTDPEGYYKLAQAFAAVGDRTSGMSALRQAIDGGFFCYPYFTNDPLLDPLRNEPGFAALMTVAEQRHERFRSRYGDGTEK